MPGSGRHGADATGLCPVLTDGPTRRTSRRRDILGRRMRPLAGLIAARLRRRGLAALLIPAAVAPAALALLVTAPVSLVAEDAALERALGEAPASARTVRVDVTKTANTQLARDGSAPGLDAETDAAARAALPRTGAR